LRDADAARFGEPLKACRQVDAVAVDVAVRLVDDVAEVDADPEPEAELRGNAGLALRRAALDRSGTGDRVHRAAEHAQDAVAHQFGDTAAMLRDQRLDELSSEVFEAAQRAVLIRLHQACVADHVRRQDGGEPPVDSGTGHGSGLRLTSPEDTTLRPLRSIQLAEGPSRSSRLLGP
jgi:hypothetical protein